MYEFLRSRNFNNIIILDNNSTYPPLLDWYSTLNENGVVRFSSNIGAHCLFDSGYLKNNEQKIGLALRIDDVPPSCYRNCFTGTIDHERQFWVNQLERDVYMAMV